MTKVVVPLADLCKMDRRQVRLADEGALNLPFVGVEHVVAGSGVIDFDSDSRVGSQKSAAFRFDARHVLYGKLRPYLNKVATPGFTGKCSTELIPLLPQDGVDRDYLAHLLRRRDTVDFVMAAVTGSRMPRADMKVLLSMRVPLPALDEQRRIVAILNRAAKIERLRARAAERMREFVPALFQSMFGDPLENPMGWRVKKLGEVCVSARYGTSKKAATASTGVPVIRMGNVTYNGELECAELKFVVLSDAEFEKQVLKPGDILFNRTNSKELVGKTGVWDGRFEAVAASYFIRLRVDAVQVCPSYVWAFFNAAATKRMLYGMARGAIGQANINATELQSLLLPVPPIELQRGFAEIVDHAQNSRNISKTCIAGASALTQSLMGQLLSTSGDVSDA